MAERPHFIDQIERRWADGKLVCVGLDPDFSRIPPHLLQEARDPGSSNYNVRNEAIFTFLKGVVDATADLVCAYKPNVAFFSGKHNDQFALQKLTRYIHYKYPDIPVIGDSKRADIGNTNKYYAQEMFEKNEFDAITTNPYFGHDTYAPFLKYPGKGLIALCKTSNPEAAFYQDAPVDIYDYEDIQDENKTPLSDREMELMEVAAKHYLTFRAKQLLGDAYKAEKDMIIADSAQVMPLYQIVALRTATLAQKYPNIGVVVGATHPEAFEPVRMLIGDTGMLIPGIGTQGGDLEKTLKFAPREDRAGVAINSASAILYASKERDFADASRAAALKLHNQIQQLR